MHMYRLEEESNSRWHPGKYRGPLEVFHQKNFFCPHLLCMEKLQRKLFICPDKIELPLILETPSNNQQKKDIGFNAYESNFPLFQKYHMESIYMYVITCSIFILLMLQYINLDCLNDSTWNPFAICMPGKKGHMKAVQQESRSSMYFDRKYYLFFVGVSKVKLLGLCKPSSIFGTARKVIGSIFLIKLCWRACNWHGEGSEWAGNSTTGKEGTGANCLLWINQGKGNLGHKYYPNRASWCTLLSSMKAEDLSIKWRLLSSKYILNLKMSILKGPLTYIFGPVAR